jgi:hypothetical protein
MPSQATINAVANKFADQYSIQIANVRNDEQRLQAIVASAQTAPVDSKSIYKDSATYTYNGDFAFVADLETDIYAGALDWHLNKRRVEQNLEDAKGYLQRCLQLRQQYGELAKLRNDTRFKGEEFVRLDLVHLEEVDAGLYKLPWQEAADDRAALETAVGITEEMMRGAATGPGYVYSTVLSESRVQQYISDAADLAKNASSSPLKNDIRQGAAATTKYRTQIENATWQQELAAVRGKLATAQRKEAYLRKDEGFRSHRAAISRQLAWLQMHEHCRENSALNYSERLIRQKALFDINLQCLIERVRVLEPGLRDTYHIDIPVGTPNTGSILDTLSVWLVKAQNELSKYKQFQRMGVYPARSNGTLQVTPRTSSSSLDTLRVDLTVGVPSGDSRLRGINFEYFGDQRRPIELEVSPPGGIVGAPLHFGRVCPFTPALEPKPQYADMLWNASPLGTWQVQGRFDQGAGAISDLVMYVWLAYQTV